MYEDRTQNYDPEIQEEYPIHYCLQYMPSACYIMYSHVKTQLIRLKGNIFFYCDCESKLWIFKFL